MTLGTVGSLVIAFYGNLSYSGGTMFAPFLLSLVRTTLVNLQIGHWIILFHGRLLYVFTQGILHQSREAWRAS